MWRSQAANLDTVASVVRRMASESFLDGEDARATAFRAVYREIEKLR
jgi:hypothetical protein